MNMSMEFDPVSKAELQQAMARAPLKVVEGIGDWVKRSALRVERQAKQEVPVDEGALQSSIRSAFAEAGLEAKVAPHKRYALYVHEGTGLYGPHHQLIRPKNAKLLSWKSGGRTVVARYTRGQKANPFMKRAYDTTKPVIEADASKALSKIVESI